MAYSKDLKEKLIAYLAKGHTMRVAECLAELEKVQGRPVVYVDETGLDTWLHREHGWSERGAPVEGKVRGRRHERTGVVAALWEKTVMAPCQYGGTMDSEFFEGWFELALLPAMPAGSVIVMDNATFHRKAKLRALLEGSGYALLFLPPYSPELNPIEHFWSWLKRHLRKILPSHTSFSDALCSTFQVH
ncbi:MAG: IS630 family transposase [Holophagales bacterium]|nr:IS630 family transposase [Holophagales bacterium]